MIYPQNMVTRLPAMTYIHILDTNTQAITLETGPKTFVCLSGHKVIFGPEKFVTVPPQHYVTVSNPVVLDKDGKVVLDGNGQALLQHGDMEVRTERAPFPLFPGEKLDHAVRALPTVPMNGAMRMEATRDIVAPDGKVIHRVGEEWLEIGPKVLVPHPGARIVSQVSNYLIAPNEALHMRATRDLVDVNGEKRVAGEEYLVRTVGSYLPILDEQVLGKVTATVLTPKIALCVIATGKFVDQFGKERNIGDQWLVTNEQTESYIPSVNEKIARTVPITALSSRQFCVIQDPVDPATGLNQYGTKTIRRGPAKFFLLPDEVLVRGPEEVTVLQEDQAMELMATERFEDKVGTRTVVRNPGETWRLVGPAEYWFPLEVRLLTHLRPVARVPSLGIMIFDKSQLYLMAALLFFLLVLLVRFLY
jgi:major vault protein